MKPWMIITVVVAVLAVVLILMKRDNPTVTNDVQVPPTNNSQRVQEADQKEPVTPTTEQKISYDGSSFSPNELKITKGTKVIFENMSDSSMWVASDPHPTHTGLPSLNTGRGYGKGENYTYTFNESGSWGFHNHLNSSHTGKVVVN